MAVYEMENGFALLKQKKKKFLKKKKSNGSGIGHNIINDKDNAIAQQASYQQAFSFVSNPCLVLSLLYIYLCVSSFYLFFYWLYKVILLFFFSLLIVSWWVLELGILAFKRTRQFIYYGRWPEQSKVLDSVFNPIIDEFINSLNGC